MDSMTTRIQNSIAKIDALGQSDPLFLDSDIVRIFSEYVPADVRRRYEGLK